MRVVCLVPSLTETLIECGVEVVGRTCFCIHPAERVKDIKKVGGTKGVDWQKCAELKPDLVVFDREENLKSMADECPFDWHATHMTSVDNIGEEFIKLAELLDSSALFKHGEDWQQLVEQPNLARENQWQDLPGFIASLNDTQKHYTRLEYVIWRDPWMVIGQNTFIYSMLEKFGFANALTRHAQRYPKLDDKAMMRDDTFYLFSSEPYPFEKHQQGLIEMGFNGAIVDGELYSWHGIRSYRHLEQKLLALKTTTN